MCKKCGVLVQKISMPSATVCPSGGKHQWSMLGEVGNNSYQCSRCGALVKSKSNPNSSTCPSGGGYMWRKL
jgi:DNA-directed RNA polymerase subunit RPC12/RpoP